jgi:hypothetical protein
LFVGPVLHQIRDFYDIRATGLLKFCRIRRAVEIIETEERRELNSPTDCEAGLFFGGG